MKKITLPNLKYLNLFLFLILICIIAINCKDSVSVEDLDSIIIPDKNVSFGQYLHPVFNVKCTQSGCHNDESRAGGYSVTTWANVKTPGIVNPGDVETSRLLWMINGGVVGKIMPPLGYPPLTDNQRNGIKQWILEGALNN